LGGQLFPWLLRLTFRKSLILKAKNRCELRGLNFAGTKALLELQKMNPEKDVQYISIPGSQPKTAAMQQGIIHAAR
jgi:hypothetical protein